MSIFKTRVFSRHPSHNILRKYLVRLPIRSLIRLGSITTINDDKERIELNSVDSIKISSNKLLMKKKFNEVDVPTAPWFGVKTIDEIFIKMNDLNMKFPIVAKSLFGSQGVGNYLIKDEFQLKEWSNNRNLNNYIFEKYMPYQLEYRLHVTKNGYFYSCRKALRTNTEEKDRWRRHKDNSVWLLETNENFNKPNSWDDIVDACVKALINIGADILSFDVRVQSPFNKEEERREYQKFILLECNSASSMAPVNSDKELSICAEKYLEIIPQLIMEKYNAK